VKKLKVLKIGCEGMPKPRRKATLEFVGNCLVMFGGFNSEYFNDLHYVNITENVQKTLYYHQIMSKTTSNRRETEDVELRLKNGKIYCCYKEILLEFLKNEEDLASFIMYVGMLEN
jgi:hypothetical protein